jgi:type I restriction enzyme S subunit
MKWEKAAIKSVCKGIYDGPHATPPVSDTGAIFLGISNFSNGRLDLSDIRFISENDLPRWTKRVTPQASDIVFSYEATLNLYAVIPDGFRGCLGRRMALIRVDEEKAYYKFLYYYFYSDAWRVVIQENTVLGATVDRIPLVKFPDFLIDLPPLVTQHRIADILSAYDNLIENNQKQIKLLEEATQRLYKEWFVDLCFPGYEDVKIVDGVPEGWKKDTIDSRIELLSGYAFKSSEFNDEGKYKIITIKNVKDGQFDGDNVNCMINIPEKMPEHCKLVDGDILLSLTGNVGRVCIVHGENFLLNQRIAKLRSNNMAYTYCLFRSKDMFDNMNNLTNGVAQQNLSPIRTGKINIVFPTDALIQMFEKTVNPMLNKITVLNKSILSLSQARDRLLPKLMNGEIEV